MDIQRLLIWVCFILCLGLTVGGVMVFFRLRERGTLPAVRLMQYYLVMMYAFGFYAFWSDVLLRLLFPVEQEEGLIPKISNFLSLLGAPFLLIGLIMLALWGVQMLLKKSTILIITSSGLGLLAIALPYLLTQQFEVLLHTEQLFSSVTVAVVLFTLLPVTFLPIRYLKGKAKTPLLAILLLIGLTHGTIFLPFLSDSQLELLFIFFFFLTNTGLGVYFLYAGDFPSLIKEKSSTLTLDGFVQKYGITTREKDVIMEIYKGKTNQEVADTLFVTLQTIKDHTSRIYQKTEVKNRNQLTSLVRKFEKPA
ncbi:MAG: LuxR C-terminal-related transcriptional regulator [Bacteroidota bacterium]